MFHQIIFCKLRATWEAALVHLKHNRKGFRLKPSESELDMNNHCPVSVSFIKLTYTAKGEKDPAGCKPESMKHATRLI